MTPEPILVIGGGPAGMAAAIEIASRGLRAELFEQTSRLSGKAWEYGCKADSECRSCNVCKVHRMIRQVQDSQNILTHLRSTVFDIQHREQRFTVSWRDETGDTHSTTSSSIVIATGFDFFDPHLCSRYGYGRIPDVITSAEFERQLQGSSLPKRISDGSAPGAIGFIQCVGSRDPRGGAPFCSQTCCAYSLRMASRLVYLDPDLQVTIFYSDLQSLSPETDRLLNSLNPRIRLVRSLPAEIIRLESGRLEVTTESDMGTMESHEFHTIVLAIGFRPSQSLRHSILGIGLELNPYGFIQEPAGSGVLAVVGAALGPMNLAKTIDQSISAVTRMITLNRGSS